MRPKISAVIHTLNEELNIANALKSVISWVDEIIVVDMNSDDKTVEIARSFGAKVFFFERCGSADPARNFSQEQATGDWIFALDADELAPIELSKELIRIAENDVADICYIPELNYFGGFPLEYTGWGPRQDKHARFFRKGSIVFPTSIHTRVKEAEGSRRLDIQYRPGLAIVHFNYVNISHFLVKLNRYTDIEASQRIVANKPVRTYDVLVRPPLEFINRYIRRQGFRDGLPGLYYSIMMAVYRMTQAMKLRELEVAGSSGAIHTKYQSVADGITSSYLPHPAEAGGNSPQEG